MRPWSGDDVVEALLVPGEPDVAGQLVLVTSAPTDPVRARAALERLATLPCVVVGTEPDELVDAAVAEDELDDVRDTFDRAPLASAALALHLRASGRRTPEDALVAESALYSALQGGPEHRAWRAATPRRDPGDAGEPRVRMERSGAALCVTLTRPGRRNALDAAMRDQLLDALAVAEADPDVHLVLRGEGPAFCAGGDLDEFGTAPDPATAHSVRLRRSIGAVLHRLRDRTTVHVQGANAGSGVELAAFAGHVRAAPDATFVLPELGMGLVPGAGGTVSLPARIGRHRTAWLALTRRSIDAETAVAWGVADAIELI